MQSSLTLDRFIRKRQAPAESNCGEEEECQEKEPKTTEDMEDSSSRRRKSYEEKRKQEGRLFRQEWKKTFAWLQFDETKQEMFCTACREFPSLADKNSSVFYRKPSFSHWNIKAHASNRRHEACVFAKQQREQQERGSRNVQSLRQMSSDTEEKMKSYLISLILLQNMSNRSVTSKTCANFMWRMACHWGRLVHQSMWIPAPPTPGIRRGLDGV